MPADRPTTHPLQGAVGPYIDRVKLYRPLRQITSTGAIGGSHEANSYRNPDHLVGPGHAPPQGELAFDQSSGFDPSDAEPIPDFDFDRSRLD
jgi:hypothetical protein